MPAKVDPSKCEGSEHVKNHVLQQFLSWRTMEKEISNLSLHVQMTALNVDYV
jgi:hypothetical protein